jgi:hypothetical protein
MTADIKITAIANAFFFQLNLLGVLIIRYIFSPLSVALLSGLASGFGAVGAAGFSSFTPAARPLR